MPELPEVETTCCGIAPHITGKVVKSVTLRHRQLRWPIPAVLKRRLPGQRIEQVSRRGKYLFLHTAIGTVIIHLGMSGSLRIAQKKDIVEKHDHVDIEFSDKCILRLRDPRRFGAVLWTQHPPTQHKLIRSLGPEPLSDDFTVEGLFQTSRKRQLAVKTFIMDSKIVVGVGNIYASEALFRAGIRPSTAAGRVSKLRYQRLVSAIKAVLSEAIKQGGTTLRDFTNSDDKPGYFQQKLQVYGRDKQPCVICGAAIKRMQQGQRTTYYCSHCQR
ncbi:MAG: bifunctional DNA-formamidopyrimidine glycosylase/DNA-(apurinic or apyrimidinic site) lyase [Ectothiorhodospiraceae bacterium]|nr:bifunctional DNA-formamidopyrimidine glycosylase/DNA-(apurinic or apyrimidinic site) lyase [Ectothiorhodospiraceae bacterium]